MPGDHEEREVTISGVKVVFPCKPYPSQFGMMDRVIKGLDRRQNCLLESPTGSGKSLALLCSALAWQNSLHLKLAKEAASAANDSTGEKRQGGSCKPCQCKSDTSNKGQAGFDTENKVETDIGTSKDPLVILDDDDDDDFKVPSKFRTPSTVQKMRKQRVHMSIAYEDGSPGDEKKSCDACTCQSRSPTVTNKEKVPKIYFGTRTHKQIAQIVRELGKTAYHDVRMLILASREYTCVHPEVIRLKNKSEGCRDRLDAQGPGCSFNDRAKRVFLNQAHLQNELSSAWDLEDLVHACKKKKACPYFVTRNIKDEADIIFCPYNYLIDPLVRKSMDINLKDQVVILDEAHNIEDCARDAASGKLTTQQITLAIRNLQELLDANVKFSDHLTLKRMMENVLKFVEDNQNQLNQSDYDTSYKVWSGFDMVARLKSIGLGPDTINEYKSCLENISASDDDQQQNTMKNFRGMEIKLQSSSLKLLELLLQILDYMYRDDLKFVEDYRVAIMKSIEYVAQQNTNDSWLGRNKRGKTRQEVFTINFWCMNPAVAFSDFNPCRNVVLSSGTLSPMTSFASELGVPFPIQLEANHVIKEDQVWVGSVGQGPSGSQLQAVYKNMETFTFQDELGNFILQVCQKVPHGVLCFLPSYRALEKFTERWKLTRVWEKLSSLKKIHVEPRAADREDFDYMMKQFYAVVKDPSCADSDDDYDCEDTSERTGAVFFAVCRGKVSEGMDFADNNARAVITVGIPFPSIKDLQVKLKREYNDRYRSERGLLSGNEWYEIQAFRALNQALGRCIRHRKDWGAIIIVDDRFVKMAAKYNKGLSKWVRNKVRTFEEYPRFLESVSNFTDKMEREMPVINPDTSFIPCTPSTPAVRRRSVYNGNPPQTTSSPMNDSLATSPYFMNFSGSSPRLMETPDKMLRSGTSNTSAPDPVRTSLPQLDPNLTQVIAPAIPGVPVYNQLVKIMNSVCVPKDKPYCIILNKGLPDEQIFHVDPSKLSQQELNGASKAQSLLQGGSKQTIDPSASSTIGSNIVSHRPNEQVNTAAEPVKRKLKTFVANGPSPSKPIEEQLKQVLSSPSLPKYEPYYIVLNKGHPEEQTLLIEPNKKFRKGFKQDKGEANLKTEDPVQINTTKPEVMMPKTEAKPSSQTDPNTFNQTDLIKIAETESSPFKPVKVEGIKFLKFCNLPKTVDEQDKVTKTKQHTKSPVLFENGSDSPDANDKDKNVLPEQSVASSGLSKSAEKTKRKPLFKKGDQDKMNSDSLSRKDASKKTQKRNTFDTDVHSTRVVDDADLNKDKSDALETKLNDKSDNCQKKVDLKVDASEDETAPTRKRSSRGKFDRSVLDKLKSYRKRSTELMKEMPTKSVGSDVLLDVSNELKNIGKQTLTEGDVPSDEEFLCTRRKSGRKRSSSGSSKQTIKRQKGVLYEDEVMSAKENKTAIQKGIHCTKCGNVLITSPDYKQKKGCPSTIKKQLGQKHEEVIHVDISNICDSFLQGFNLSHNNGPVLDSHYIEEMKCCVQYLQCKHCSGKDQSVIGARVIMTETQSDLHVGQTWLISSKLKTQ